MFNIIKADNTRLLKSKSFWITLGFFAILFIGIMYMQNTANKEFINTTNSGKEAGFYITVDFVIKSLNSFVTIFGYPFGTLFLGIYLSIFVCNEYSSGYIKNIVTLDEGRVGIVLAKAAVACVITILILVITYGLGFSLGNIIIDRFKIDSINEILKSIGIMFLLSMAMFSLIIFTSTLFKSKVAGIIVAFLVISGMSSRFINSFFDLIHLSFLSEYTLSHFSNVYVSAQGDVLIKMIVMCIIYILVYNILSIAVLSKRDL